MNYARKLTRAHKENIDVSDEPIILTGYLRKQGEAVRNWKVCLL